jgi:3-phosphoshikimate 1-carboxyvinyltransferase
MRVTVQPGSRIEGTVTVPGDKSIAHRWLILAATARGRSNLHGLPDALDVRSTSSVLTALTRSSRGAALEGWVAEPALAAEGDGSTSNTPRPRRSSLRLEARGRGALEAAEAPLDCGNSGTTMRLMAGVLAAAPFTSTLTGDASVSSRPMERVGEPLRAMGAAVETTDGHAPVRVTGGELHGITHRSSVPSAQVKSAILLAGVAADGETTVEEPAATRDHTERALEALGAPVRVDGGSVSIRRFQHDGFSASVPGDVSSATFILAAAALTDGRIRIEGVGLNPSRTYGLEILRRAGLAVEVEVETTELGEPVGTVTLERGAAIRGVRVSAEELPLVIDEVPILALLAAHAPQDTWFLGAGELRVKESDRLEGVAATIRALGGHAAVEGDDLVVAGGGLDGGSVSAGGDHRMAMAAFVGGLGARGPVTIDGMEAAAVSFPGFLETVVALGAEVGA